MPKVCEDQTESPLETLSCSPFGDLSVAERKIMRAALRGDFAWCGPNRDDKDSANDPANGEAWEKQRAVRAKLIRWLCIDKEVRPHIDPKGIRIHGARIIGELDLEYAEIPFPLFLRRCLFQNSILLSFARSRTVSLEGSLTGPITGLGWIVEGSLFLRNKFRVRGAVRLVGAKISRALVCTGSAFENPGREALVADEINVGGSVYLNGGFRADGAVRMVGAEIGGLLICEACIFSNPDGDALVADGIRVAGSIVLREGFQAAGRVSLLRAEIGGDLDCTGGTFRHRGEQALIADGAKIAGYVFLRRKFSAEGEVRLNGARIRADLDCEAGLFSHRNKPALNAEGAKIEGSVYLDRGFTAIGEVKLQLAEVGGDLDSEEGCFDNPTERAFTANEIKIAGNLHLRHGFRASGEVRLPGATIGGNFQCDGGSFSYTNPDGSALFAPGIHVRGNVTLSDHITTDGRIVSFSALGQVRLVRSDIAGNLKLDGARLRNKGGHALAADGIKVGGSVQLQKGFRALGKVHLPGAKIAGNLECDGAHIFSPSGDALVGQGAKVAGYVYLREGFHAGGTVNFVGSEIGRDLICNNSRFARPLKFREPADASALRADGAVISGSVFCNGNFTARGLLSFHGAQLDGELDLAHVRFISGSRFSGLNARRATIKGRFQWTGITLDHHTMFDLRDANAGRLCDDVTSWPTPNHILLDGFVYSHIADGPTEAKSRLQWVRRQPFANPPNYLLPIPGNPQFASQPYRQLAKVLRDSGHEADAKKVMIECETDRSRYGGLSRTQQTWWWILKKTIGYGYRPQLAAYFAIVIWLAGWFVFCQAKRADLMTTPPNAKADYATTKDRMFSPMIYSLDSLLPVGNLGQKEYWLPDPSRSCKVLGYEASACGQATRDYLFLHTIAGWILGTLFVAGMSGMVRHE
jgi:hypothetical protein